MAWHVWESGAWRYVVAPHVAVGGEQKQVARAYVFVGGAWERYWPDKEPTVTTIDGGLGSIPVGAGSTVFGTVTTEIGAITGGTVTLYQRLVGEGEGDWVQVGSTVIFNPGSAVGNWSMTATPTKCGLSVFRAVYEGTVSNGESQAEESSSVYVQVPALPTGGAITNDSLSISWDAVPGVDAYWLKRDGVAIDSVSAGTLSYTFTGLSAGTQYGLIVEAVSGDCSAESPEKVGTTSADEVRDTGSATIQVDSWRSGSWRPDVGWGYIDSRVGQGYYSVSSRNYTGCVDYGGASVMRGKVVAALGENGDGRFDNGTISGARVYLHKLSGVGSGGSVTASFYHSAAEVDAVDAEPPRLGTVVDEATSVSGAGKWYDIGVEHGDAIARGTGGARSLLMYDLGTSNYLQMQGRSFSADSCDMEMDWAWDYVSQPSVPGEWLN